MEYIVGFFVGIIITGIYINWFLRYLKKNDYIMFEPTDKLKKKIK